MCKMIEFLIDTIFVQFGRCLFRQVNGILKGTNCAPSLAGLILQRYVFSRESGPNCPP